jgi:hypothetical protein
MRTNPNKARRDLSGPLHRKIRQGVGTPWAQLHAQLKEYADRKRLPRWQLRKAIEADVIRKPKFDDEGILVTSKGKPEAPGSLYVNSDGILVKWIKPVVQEEEDLGYVQMPHPDYPKVITKTFGDVQATSLTFGVPRKGKWTPRVWTTIPVKRHFKFFLEQHDGIWYEVKYQIRNPNSQWSWSRMVYQHQLDSRKLRRFKLSNQRAA